MYLPYKPVIRIKKTALLRKKISTHYENIWHLKNPRGIWNWLRENIEIYFLYYPIKINVISGNLILLQIKKKRSQLLRTRKIRLFGTDKIYRFFCTSDITTQSRRHIVTCLSYHVYVILHHIPHGTDVKQQQVCFLIVFCQREGLTQPPWCSGESQKKKQRSSKILKGHCLCRREVKINNLFFILVWLLQIFRAFIFHVCIESQP